MSLDLSPEEAQMMRDNALLAGMTFEKLLEIMAYRGKVNRDIATVGPQLVTAGASVAGDSALHTVAAKHKALVRRLWIDVETDWVMDVYLKFDGTASSENADQSWSRVAAGNLHMLNVWQMSTGKNKKPQSVEKNATAFFTNNDVNDCYVKLYADLVELKYEDWNFIEAVYFNPHIDMLNRISGGKGRF